MSEAEVKVEAPEAGISSEVIDKINAEFDEQEKGKMSEVTKTYEDKVSELEKQLAEFKAAEEKRLADAKAAEEQAKVDALKAKEEEIAKKEADLAKREEEITLRKSISTESMNETSDAGKPKSYSEMTDKEKAEADYQALVGKAPILGRF